MKNIVCIDNIHILLNIKRNNNYILQYLNQHFQGQNNNQWIKNLGLK